MTKDDQTIPGMPIIQQHDQDKDNQQNIVGSLFNFFSKEVTKNASRVATGATQVVSAV